MSEPVRTTTKAPCPYCGEEGAWSSLGADAVFAPPRGHTVEYLDERREISFDSCPVGPPMQPSDEE